MVGDKALKMVIEEMWEIYDDDKNGELDKREARNFAKDALAALYPEECFREDIYQEMFKIFDDDNSGSLDKTEICPFLKYMINQYGIDNGIDKNGD